jgi:uncharacterized protein (DUF983 family)
MQRICPNCSQRSIPLSGLLLGACRCAACGHYVRVNRVAGFLFSILTVVITALTSYAVFALHGIYAVIIWFAFPVGAIGYIKARFSPLTAFQADRGT